MAIVFPEKFAESLTDPDALTQSKPNIQILCDASDPNTATTLLNYASAIMQDWNA